MFQIITSFDHFLEGAGIINGGADAPSDSEYRVVRHQKTSRWFFHPSKVGLFLPRAKGKNMPLFWWRWQLQGKLLLGANDVRFLLSNQHHVPLEWKFDERGACRPIYFAGTEYEHPVEGLCIPFIIWDCRDGWIPGSACLTAGNVKNCMVAVRHL